MRCLLTGCHWPAKREPRVIQSPEDLPNTAEWLATPQRYSYAMLCNRLYKRQCNVHGYYHDDSKSTMSMLAGSNVSDVTWSCLHLHIGGATFQRTQIISFPNCINASNIPILNTIIVPRFFAYCMALLRYLVFRDHEILVTKSLSTLVSIVIRGSLNETAILSSRIMSGYMLNTVWMS